MTDRTISHGTFTVERRFAARPERVFKAWSDPDQLKKWAAPADDWAFDIDRFEFRVGGTSVCRFGPQGDVPYQDSGRYDDIVPDRRIVSAYAISKGEVRISSSVSSMEFVPDGTGTLLRITEVGAYFDGQDSAKGRQGGVLHQLDQLSGFLMAS
jgi:uncharacterized protein YndB with AHSA1/START domain